MSITLHPEIEELRRQLIELKGQLRQVMDDWHQLTTVVRPQLHALYHQHFGELERELQYASLESAELFRRVELLSIKVTRGEILTPKIIELVNQLVDAEYARFKMRIREAFDMDARQREQHAVESQGKQQDAELVNMYRTLVKQLHPDVASSMSSDDIAVWHRVQHAYATKNAAQLQSLLTLMGVHGDLQRETLEWTSERWQEEVQRLQTRVRVEQRKLRKLRSEEPFTMESLLENESLRSKHRSELEHAIATKRREMQESAARYAEFTGGMVPPGTNVVDSKEQQDFNEDFLMNTYFGQR